MSNSHEKAVTGNRLEQFIQKNRKPIIAGVLIVITAAICTAAAFAIRDTLRSRTFVAFEELNRRYELLRFDITNEEKKDDVQALLTDVKAFAERYSGYASGRAWAAAGNIHADRKEWAESEAAWSNAAKVSVRTYLEPVAFFNAAVAAEEQGNISEALRLYGESISLSDAFPAAPRAQFSIARLQEAQNDKTAALEAYRLLVSKWPQDPIWTNLAQSRIIDLEK